MSATFLDDIRRRQADIERAKAAGMEAAATAQPAPAADQPAPPTGHKGRDWGLLGDALNAGKVVGSAIGTALDVGNKYVTRPVLGAGVQFFDHRDNSGESFTDSWNRSMSDHPWLKFGSEAVLDPLNLVGVGLVGKAAKVPRLAELLGTAAKVGDAYELTRRGQKLVAADELADRIQSLPITVPLGLTRKGLAKVGGKWLERSPTAGLHTEGSVLSEEIDKRGQDVLNYLGRINADTDSRVIEHLTNPDIPDVDKQQAISTLYDGKLWRVYQTIDKTPETKPLTDQMVTELRSRELLKPDAKGQIVPTGKLSLREQVDRVADNAQLGDDERQLYNDVFDILARTIYNSNPSQYRSIDDAYSTVSPFLTYTSDKNAINPLKTGEFRGVTLPTGQVGLSPKANLDTLIHETLGHALRANMSDGDVQRIVRELGGQTGEAFEERFANGVMNFLRTGKLEQFPPEYREIIERIRQHTGEQYRLGTPEGTLPGITQNRLTNRMSGLTSEIADQPPMPTFARLAVNPENIAEQAAENPNLPGIQLSGNPPRKDGSRTGLRITNTMAKADAVDPGLAKAQKIAAARGGAVTPAEVETLLDPAVAKNGVEKAQKIQAQRAAGQAAPNAVDAVAGDVTPTPTPTTDNPVLSTLDDGTTIRQSDVDEIGPRIESNQTPEEDITLNPREAEVYRIYRQQQELGAVGGDPNSVRNYPGYIRAAAKVEKNAPPGYIYLAGSVKPSKSEVLKYVQVARNSPRNVEPAFLEEVKRTIALNGTAPVDRATGKQKKVSRAISLVNLRKLLGYPEGGDPQILDALLELEGKGITHVNATGQITLEDKGAKLLKQAFETDFRKQQDLGGVGGELFQSSGKQPGGPYAIGQSIPDEVVQKQSEMSLYARSLSNSISTGASGIEIEDIVNTPSALRKAGIFVHVDQDPVLKVPQDLTNPIKNAFVPSSYGTDMLEVNKGIGDGVYLLQWGSDDDAGVLQIYLSNHKVTKVQAPTEDTLKQVLGFRNSADPFDNYPDIYNKTPLVPRSYDRTQDPDGSWLLTDPLTNQVSAHYDANMQRIFVDYRDAASVNIIDQNRHMIRPTARDMSIETNTLPDGPYIIVSDSLRPVMVQIQQGKVIHDGILPEAFISTFIRAYPGDLSKGWNGKLPTTLLGRYGVSDIDRYTDDIIPRAVYRLMVDREIVDTQQGTVNRAVRHYTSAGYGAMNGAARTGSVSPLTDSRVRHLTEHGWKALTREMDEYIRTREPLGFEATVFRGVKDVTPQVRAAVENAPVGVVFSDSGYTSVSTAARVADGFGATTAAPHQSLFFRVHLPETTKAAIGFPGEYELILPRGAVFEITNKQFVRLSNGDALVVDVMYHGSPQTGEILATDVNQTTDLFGNQITYEDELWQGEKNPLTNIFSSSPLGRRSGEVSTDTIDALPEDVVPTRGEQLGLTGPADDSARLTDQTLSPLRDDATVTDAIGRVAYQAGLPEGSTGEVFVRDTLKDVVTDNPTTFQALRLVSPQVNDALVQAMKTAEEGNTDEAKQLIADAMWTLNQKQLSFGMRMPALAKLQKILPANKQTAAGTRALGRGALGTTETSRVIEVLELARNNPKVQKFQQMYDKALPLVEATVNEMSKAGAPIPEFNELTTVGEIRNALKFANDEQKKAINAYLSLEGANVDSRTSADVFKEGFLSTYHRARAKDLGIPYERAPRGIEKVAKTLMKGWREQALLSVRYHTVNALDITARSLVYGINPTAGRSAQKLAKLLNVNPPPDLLIFGHEAEGAREGLDVVDDAARPVLGRLPGIAGKAGGWLVNNNRKLGRVMENSARLAAWSKGLTDHLTNEFIPAYRDELTRVLGANETSSKLAKDLLDAEGHVSSDKLYEMVIARGGTAGQASELSTIWEKGLNEASDRGRELSHHIHFDYIGDVRNIEEKLGVMWFLPFHFWATRNIPFYLDTLGAHPELARLWQTYDQVSDDYREERGLTSRFQDTLPLNVPLLDLIFGPGTGYFNPLVALSIADQTKPRFTADDATVLGKGLNELGRVGITPGPWVVTPLTIAGAYGDRAEAPELLRHSQIIGTALEKLGFNPPSPIRDTVDAAQAKFTGKEKVTISGDSYKDRAITNRIAEMSLEETGRANDPAYIQAMADPSSPIYQRAAAQVSDQSVFNELYSFFSPFPLKYLNDTEAGIRGERKALADQFGGTDKVPPEVWQALAAAGVPAMGYSNAGDDGRARQINAGFSLLKNVPYQWGYTQRAFVDQNYPYLARYRQWLDQQPAGAPRGVDDFLKAT